MVQYPDLTVTYFDGTGRAEPTRLALTIAGIPFKDERIAHDDWPYFKPQTPFGQLPILTINGDNYAQSDAILRYVGQLSGLYPKDSVLALPIDMVLDECEDAFKPIGEWFHEKDPDKKKALLNDMIKNKLPLTLSALDRYICKQSSDFAIRSNMTIADLVVYNFVAFFKSGFIPDFPADIIDHHQNLMRVYNNVANHPKVMEWNQKHSKQQ